MRLSKIRIRNFRLLNDAELDVDATTTLVVGRNNTGKTSCLKCIDTVLHEKPSFSFDDYPLSKRRDLCGKLKLFLKHQISFETLSEQLEPISVEFQIDYSLDNPEENLGALSPFIIDVDPDTTIALIRAEYKLKADEQALRKTMEGSFYKDNADEPYDIAKILSTNFDKLFEMKIYAVNPKNPNELQLKKNKELTDLFPILVVPAERLLGEDGTKENSLAELISGFFDLSEEELDASISEKIMELRKLVTKANENIQGESDRILSELVDKIMGFGYPNTEELQLGVTTQLSIDEQIKNKTQLLYKQGSNNESLPSTYNGLGYKNLIKIVFLITDFARKMDKNAASIPLIYIEEPESHMHPQLQQTFASYLENFLSKLTTVKIQTILTSHSAHIANTVEFSKIRYAQKSKTGVKFKNLSTFAQQNHNNIDFIRKYLTLTKCDLFFADKAIFVEGASERLLLPDMIAKCDKEGLFNSQKYKLTEQYYTIIEVGGAYAYRFIPFIEFLNIPCLILTDLDSVARQNGSSRYSSALVSQGETTSNATLKWWVREIKKLPKDGSVTLSDLIDMQNNERTIRRCHIEFQTEEGQLCGRSLEEAIRNANREYYELGDCPEEKDIEFTEKCKTDFALKLIFEHSDYNIPAYIKNGLKWLNDQMVLE